MLKTFAGKYRTRISRIIRKYRQGKDFVVEYPKKNGKVGKVLFYNNGFRRDTKVESGKSRWKRRCGGLFAGLKNRFRRKTPDAAPEKPGRRLTAAERREIQKVVEAAKGDGKPHSAQDTLPFRQMYPDGLCRLDDTTWSRCIEFEDVNYQLVQKDDQTAIFEALCDMYNAHDASIGMELSLVCRKVNRADFRKRIEIAAQGDRFDGVRALYTDMLRGQLEHGNNGMVKTKFLVLTIEAKNSKEARARFSRITLDALNYYKAMGALAKALDGKERLAVLHGVLTRTGNGSPLNGNGWRLPASM